MGSVRVRGRAATSTIAALGLCLGATVVLTTPVASGAVASKVASCDQAYPVDQLAQGDKVTGLTVSSGTTPTGFKGEVLGTLQDGIAPGIDMVMVRLSSPEIDRVGGIWEGMSGSPVYAANGKLIGAVAYGLAYGSTPVAGVTPYADMQGALDTPNKVTVSRAQARHIAASSDVTTAQAAEGFAALDIPLGVAGVGPKRLARLDQSGARHRPWLPTDTYATGSHGVAGGPTAADIVAGGNLAATMSYGDVTMAGVGTATTVCGTHVLGFGHPMNFAGQVTYGLDGADAIYVQEDPLGVPFKVANIGVPLGTIDQDRTTGISGDLGPAPATSTVESTVTLGAGSRTGGTDVYSPDQVPAVTFYEALANGDRVLDATARGSEAQTWKITGTGADGQPFTFRGGNRYVSSSDITGDSAWDLADLVQLLTNLAGVRVDSVTESTDADLSDAVYRMGWVQQYRQRRWSTVDRRHPILATAGHVIKLRLVLTSPTGNKWDRFNLSVPRKAAGGSGDLSLERSTPYPFEWSQPHTLAKVLDLAHTMVRNDQAHVDMNVYGGSGRVHLTRRTAPVDRVIRGNLSVPVVVR
ncbi:MAG: hypothetical protein ACRDPH_16975 [Marmoricola sp.]